MNLSSLFIIYLSMVETQPLNFWRIMVRERGISFPPSCNMSLLFQENHEIDTVMTNDDVLGDSIPFDQQDAMRQFCYQALKLGIGVGTLTASPCILCLNSFAINISLPSVVILMKFS